MKGLKLWQAILLIFGCICVATGGVILYTYLTSGFGSEIVEAENINFKTDDNLYNGNLNQFEVDENFSLVVNATNENVTEKNVTLSFTKRLSNENLSTERTYVKDGVTYITNGIVSIPQNVTLGTPFNVIVETKQYQYDGMSFITNVGGITTIHAKSTNKLDSVGADVVVAVDVPVKEVRLTARDITNRKEYSITNDEVEVLQNTNFELVVNYYPTSSVYRYSDNLYKEYTGAEEYTPRVKDYCFEISAGTDIQKQYNNGEIYFTSSGNLTTGNKIATYIFTNAKKQEEFETNATDVSGESYYNAMLSYLAQNSNDRVIKNELNCTITQAKVGNMFILNSSFEAKINKLFTLVANNNNYGNGNLGLSISDTENASLSSMISQTAIRVSYKKASDDDFTYLTADDKTIVVKSIDKTIVGTTMQNNPYHFTDNNYYFFPKTDVSDLNNATWEISTSETTVEKIKIEVVLFQTQDGVTTIFDINGDKLTGGATRTAIINVSENEEDSDIVWTGNLTENLSIIYNGTNKVPSQIDISTKTNVPVTNTYQTVKYFVRQISGEGEITNNVNVKDKSIVVNGNTYYETLSRNLLFKEAGTYAVMFMTIKTDAYGKELYEYEANGDIKGYQIAKTSSEITIVVSETLQSFKKTILEINGDTTNGVFVKTKDTSMISGKNYYTYNADTKEYIKSNIDSFAEGTDYYELSYYAIKSRAENTLVLNIEVAESSTDMLKQEIENGNLKFYAVSVDGSTTIPLSPIEKTGSDWANNSDVKISYYLNLDPAVSVLSNDGKGQGFYVVSSYFNTIKTIETKIQIEDYAITKEFDNNGQKEYYNCFMIYTPDARKIENATLSNQKFDVTVGMDSNAEYTQCSIKDINGDNIDPEEGKTGKDWLNEKIKETIVLDGYGRKFGEQGNNYNVSTSQGTTAVYVANNELNFASGKENSEVIVSAGNVSYSFNLNIGSKGLYSVLLEAGEETYTNFNNLTLNKTLGKDGEYTFNITVKVGENAVELTNKNVYLKDISNEELLKMFTFNDSIVYSTNEDTLTTTTPITKFKLNEHLAQNVSLTFYVSNKDYSFTDDKKETVRFEFTINFIATVSSTINFYDKAEGEGTLTDAVYAGYSYTLDNLISLNSGSVSWGNSQYSSATWYISSEGAVSETNNATDIGTISNGKIKFYDVATVKNYPLKLYYYTGNNPNAYHCELNVIVAPNIIFKQAENNPKTEINIVALKSQEIGVSNYYSLKRNRGEESISNVVMNVKTTNVPIGIGKAADNNVVFKFKDDILEYNYNEYSRQFEVGLTLNGETICDKDGNEIVYNNLFAVVQNTPESETDNYHSNLVSFINGILTNNDNNPVHATMYNGVLALEVLSGVNYTLKTSAEFTFDDGVTAKISSTAIDGLYTYKESSGIINFVSSSDEENKMIFGENCYIYVVLNDVETGNTIAVIKVPVCISSVGEVYAYYNNSNFFTGESGKFAQADNYDLKTLLYGNEEGVPYATMTAGQEVQIAYVGSRTYYKDDGRYYYNFTSEGIYYNAVIDISITFEDGSTQNEYATILKNSEGKYYLNLNNYAGKDVLLTLKVRADSGSSHIDYIYRIMLQANITTKTTYPLAEGDDAAEYVSIATSENFNFANIFGSYAGSKANDVRFATKIIVKNSDEQEVTLVYDSTKEYYFDQNESKELLNGQYILEKGKIIYDTNGNSYTLTKSIILSDVSETTEMEIGSETKTVVRLKIAEETYLIKELEVGGNASGSAQGVVFNGFTTSETKTQNEFSVVYLIDGDTKKYTIMINDSIIAEISLTKAGVLNVSNINKEYYINLLIRRELTNVVDGDLDYRFFINNESGTTYIDYGDFATNNKDDLKKAETTINANETYSKDIYTKYSTDAGTSMTDVILDSAPQIELSYIENGEEKTIANIDTINDVTLTRVSAGKYTLSFKTADFIDRDYIVKFIFNSGDKTISTLYASLKCSVNVERTTVDITGGETISTDWIKNKFKFTNDTGADITDQISFESITSTDERNVINSDGKISSLISDVQNVTIGVKLKYGENTFYRTLTFDIKANITVKESVTYGKDHYAEETIEYGIANFYDGNFIGGTLGYEVTIPQSFQKYIKLVEISGATLKITTNNVASDVPVQVEVKFTYTSESGYTYTFRSQFNFTIKPNVTVEVNYPKPTEDITYTNETVYLNEEYSKFFNSSAVFAGSDNGRVVYKTKDGTTVTDDDNKAIITVTDLFGIEIYAKVKDEKEEEIEYYYTRDGETFTYAGKEYNKNKTYYYKFEERDHARALSGLVQDFYFMTYGAYAEGYATFQITYNEVVAEYKIYAYKEIVNMEVVNTVNTLSGVEEIFLDQLADGNIFEKNAVAKLSMGTLTSGTYYIKISNKGNVANPYYWIGFTYNQGNEDSIYVHLGESTSLKIDNEGNPIFGDDSFEKGTIIGLYATRDGSGAELFTQSGATISLCAIANMSYIYNDGTKVNYIKIDDASLYTSLISRSPSNSDDKTLIYKYNNEWYNAKINEKIKDITDTDFVKYIIGNYEVYDKYVEVNSEKTYVSAVNETINPGANGFGQLLNIVENGTIKDNNSYSQDVYYHLNDKCEIDYYVDAKNTNIRTYYTAGSGYTIETKGNNENIDLSGADITINYDNTNKYAYVTLSDGYTYIISQELTLGDCYEIVSDDEIAKDIYHISSSDSGQTIRSISPVKEADLNNYFKSMEKVGDQSMVKVMFNSDKINMFNNEVTLYTYNNENEEYTEESTTDTLNDETYYYIKISNNKQDLASNNQYNFYNALKGTDKTEYYFYITNSKFYTKVSGTYYLISILGTNYYLKNIQTNKDCSYTYNTDSKKINEIEEKTISISGKNTTYYIYNNQYFAISYTHAFSDLTNVTWDARIKEGNLTDKTFKNIETNDSLNKDNFKGVIKTITGGDYSIYQDSANNYYAIKNVDTAECKILNKSNKSTGNEDTRTVYKAQTRTQKVESATEVNENNCYAEENEIKGITINGEIYYYFKALGIYVREKDIVTKQLQSTMYEYIDLEHFNICHVSGMNIDDETAEIKFQYIIGNVKRSFDYKFKLKVDVDVRNSFSSSNKTDDAKQVEVTYTDDSSNKEQIVTINYVEVEVNKDYDFNELIGVIRESSGDVIATHDIRSSTKISIAAIDPDDFNSITTLTEDQKGALKALGVKKNSNTNGDPLLSYQYNKTQNNADGIIYNITLSPRGADNDGDYILLEYTYSVKVADFVWKNANAEEYTMKEYILLKILPDYEVSIQGVTINTTTKKDDGKLVLTNENNPVKVENFEEVGSLQDATSLAEILSNGSITSEDTQDLVVDTSKCAATYYILESNATYAKVESPTKNKFNTYYVKTYQKVSGEYDSQKTYYTYENGKYNQVTAKNKNDFSKYYEASYNLANKLQKEYIAPTTYYIYNGSDYEALTESSPTNFYEYYLRKYQSASSVESGYNSSQTYYTGSASGAFNEVKDSSESNWTSYYVASYTRAVTNKNGALNQGYKFINDQTEKIYASANIEAKISGENEVSGATKIGEVTSDGTKYYIFEFKDATSYSGYWYLSASSIRENSSGDNIYVSLNTSFYRNYQLNVTDEPNKSTDPIIKVTSKNALNSLKDYTSTYFRAEVSGNDINKYLTSLDGNMTLTCKCAGGTTCSCAGTTCSCAGCSLVETIDKGKAIKFRAKEVLFGQKDFCITLTDDYGYTIEFNFSLIGSSNPKYKTGSLELTEGKTFDIGAQYEEITATSYEIDKNTSIYVPVKIGTEDKFNEYVNKAKVTVYTTTGSVKGEQVTAKGTEGTSTEPNTPVEKQYYVTDSSGGSYLYEAKEYDSGTTYYIKLEKITATADIIAENNLPEGKVTKDENGDNVTSSKMYLDTTGNYIKIDNVYLKIASDGISATMKSPEEVKADEDVEKAYIDTIELEGIEAFGYSTQNESANNASASKYFKGSIDLSYITVQSVEFKYKNADGTYTTLKTINFKEDGSNTLATTESVYKYNTSTEIGRNVIKNNYTVPTMPGWIYGNKDTASIYMFINLNYTEGSSTESYSLPIEITVTKQEGRLIEKNMSATNVSDNVDFEVMSHFAKGAKDVKNKPTAFYNDTIVVTLPKSPAKVTMNITATKGQETLTATKTLSATSTKMDTTHYVSISQTIGRTLGPDWTVNVTFSDYDLKAVTRSGNFGFYATYNYYDEDNKELTVLGQGPAEQIIATQTPYTAVYGYGKTESSQTNETSLTLITQNGKCYFAPTEKLTKQDPNNNVVYLESGARIVEAKKDSEGNYCLPDTSETVYTDFSDCYEKEITNDKLYLVDMGALNDNGYQQIEKYYIVQYGENESAEYYQFDKLYNIYPTYFNASAGGAINDFNASYDEADTDADGYYRFNVSSWGKEVNLHYYSSSYSPNESGKTLNEVTVGNFYLELIKDNNAAAATISSDGTISVKKNDLTILDGTQYVNISIYIKASGELGAYNSDRLSYSGNDLNKTPLITIRLYLKAPASTQAQS